MLIKHQVREALREGLIPQRAAVTEAGPRPWAEKDSAQSREQGAMSNTNCSRLSGSGPRLCNEASNRVPGHCESCPKHLTWIRLKFDSSETSPGLSGCCCSPELSRISSCEPLASSLSPIRRPESQPPPLHPLHSLPLCWPPLNTECASYFCTAVTLSPGPSQHMQIHAHTHVQTHAHSYVSMHKHAYICPSYHPSCLSLHVRKTGKPLWYSLCESGSDLPTTIFYSTVWFSFAALTTV